MKKISGHIITLHMCTINHNYMMYGSWYMKRYGQSFFLFCAIFCCFISLTTRKITILKKWKKMPGYIIILHKCTKNNDHMLHCSWDTMRDGCNSCFLFWAIFCPFTPLTTQKTKILKRWKKAPGDIIILHVCAINDNHMMYGSWYTEHDRQNFLSFCTIFCTFTPPNDLKNQNFKRMKKESGDIIILHMCTIKDNHLMYGSWYMERTDRILLLFWPFFALVSP